MGELRNYFSECYLGDTRAAMLTKRDGSGLIIIRRGAIYSVPNFDNIGFPNIEARSLELGDITDLFDEFLPLDPVIPRDILARELLGSLEKLHSGDGEDNIEYIETITSSSRPKKYETIIGKC